MSVLKGKSFRAGVRLPDRKSLSSDAEITPLADVEEVVIPLLQSIGNPSIPVVSVGAQVKLGTLIARADGAVSANLHASVCGRVIEIGSRPNGQGKNVPCIVIQKNGEERDFLPPLSEKSGENILQRVAEAGIVGLGGAGFPTHVKLQPIGKVDTLLLNGAECEPYLTCDHRLMIEKTEEIIRGANYLATALGACKILIGIEVNKPNAIEAFSQRGMTVVALKKQYPMGSEKHLIYACTGRKVPTKKLPAEVGVTVQNVGTALAVCEAVELGKPLVERVVTISGEGVTTPKNILCPIGAPLSSLVEACGGSENAVKLVAGGPMTGNALTGLNAPVVKTTSGLLLLSEREINKEQPTPCINCGRCAEVCPMKLLPMQIEFYTEAGEYRSAEKYGGVLHCIECGSCSYICPARRPLAQAITRAKLKLKEEG